jgi:ribosomal protein S18 acetylase RimI-like enzyme
MEFTCRRCVPGDEEALALLGGATFLQTYATSADAADMLAYVAEEHTVHQYRHLLSDPHVKVWAIETAQGKSLIGYVVLVTRDSQNSSNCVVKRLYVLHRFHGSGLGKRLLGEAIQAANADGFRTISLQVQDLNERAQGFYSSFGFEVVHEEPFHARSRQYMVSVMRLSL